MTELADVLGAWAADGSSGALVDLARAGPVADGFELRVLAPLPEVACPVGPAAERRIMVDQTNVSVIVGESVRVKWMRPESPAPMRAVTLALHLAEAGFTATPRLYAVALRRAEGGGGDRVPVAFLDEYLTGARDGWQWCCDALQSGADGGFPEALGALAAVLHAALAMPTGVISPTVLPVGAQVVAGWARRARSLLVEVSAHVDDHDLVAGRAAAISQALDGLQTVTWSAVQPVHGDLHVGQVLRSPAGLSVIDFDGNPVVSGLDTTVAGIDREPAARDLAQLLCSIEHVARIVERRIVDHRGGGDGPQRGTPALSGWARQARSRCLAAYREGLAAVGAAELLDERLLVPFMVEQELRELVYARRHLPRWRYAPAGTLQAWFPEGPRTSEEPIAWT